MICEECIFHDAEYWESSSELASSGCELTIDDEWIMDFIHEETGIDMDDFRDLLEDVEKCPFIIKVDYSMYENYVPEFPN